MKPTQKTHQWMLPQNSTNSGVWKNFLHKTQTRNIFCLMSTLWYHTHRHMIHSWVFIWAFLQQKYGKYIGQGRRLLQVSASENKSNRLESHSEFTCVLCKLLPSLWSGKVRVHQYEQSAARYNDIIHDHGLQTFCPATPFAEAKFVRVQYKGLVTN